MQTAENQLVELQISFSAERRLKGAPLNFYIGYFRISAHRFKLCVFILKYIIEDALAGYTLQKYNYKKYSFKKYTLEK